MNGDYNKMLTELDRLERLSENYSLELRYLSKRVRNDLWDIDINTSKLGSILRAINDVFSFVGNIIGHDTFYSLDTVIEYIRNLAKYSIFYKPSLDAEYFNTLISDIQLKSAASIIEQQWEDIYASDDGYKSFIDIFDDIFTHCINVHKQKFFHPLRESDILCRVVEGWNHNKERFIPWPSKTHNRWNPPGKQYLYLSFCEKETIFNPDISVSEYISLEEVRAEEGHKYSFCYFTSCNPGNILDLSYNDASMTQIKRIVDDYYNQKTQSMIDELLNDPKAKEKYRDKKRLKEAVQALMDRDPIDKRILEESYAKQYLKMICSCIYKKVDETDEVQKERAYKSFHILSNYLENKDVTGIIYPCTRTTKVIGKNLVLFNINDALPIESSIKEFIYV